MSDELPDADLVREVRTGNDDAFRELVNRHLPAIYTFCSRFTGSAEDAHDAAQETFVKAWQHLERFDVNKSFRAWLFTIARNTATDLMRKRKHIPFSFFDSEESENSIADTIQDDEPLPDELFDANARAAGARIAIESLKPRDQLIITMRYEEELSFEEIAKILKIPPATVRSLHRRALATLREHLS